LTPRELEILRQLVAGMPNKVIANQLNLAEVTVKLHVRRVLKKLGVRNRAAAVAAAIRARLVRLP
jgi:two-component system nitrate/nitrite response regulator NarL